MKKFIKLKTVINVEDFKDSWYDNDPYVYYNINEISQFYKYNDTITCLYVNNRCLYTEISLNEFLNLIQPSPLYAVLNE